MTAMQTPATVIRPLYSYVVLTMFVPARLKRQSGNVPINITLL